MNATSNHLEDLARVLARPESSDPDVLRQWLLERQETVARLQAIDASSWEEPDRRRFRRAIEQVLSDDEALVAELREQQDRLKEQLFHSLKNKKALRGYRLDPAVQGRTQGVKA